MMDDGSNDKRDLAGHLEWIWKEIRELSRQVESGTRREGRIARLRFEIRGLRQDLAEHTSLLGRLVYDAQRNRSRRPALASIEGYDEAVARIDELRNEISTREQRIAELRAGSDADAA